jgi:hypothetical protein
VKVCAACHPPASPKVVRAWLWCNVPGRVQ